MSCKSSAELLYKELSENIISLYQSAQLDQQQFEKYRDEIFIQREADIQGCVVLDTKSIKPQSPSISPAIQNAESRREPASINPVYEEIHPTED